MEAALEPVGRAVPARYGKACTSCTKAKCRCVYRVDGPDCERCHRLGKRCDPSTPQRRRNVTRSAGAQNALEAKLNEVVALLRNQPIPRNAAAQGLNSQAEPITPAASAIVSEGGLSSGDFLAEGSTAAATTSLRASGSLHVDTSAALPDLPFCASQPTGLEAEEALWRFQKYIIDFFPFVYIPPGTTARQLQESSPFLHLNIMSIACQDPYRQRAMSDHIKQTGHHRKEKPFLSFFVSIASGLICELQLHKPIVEPPLGYPFTDCTKSAPQPAPEQYRPSERRAVLALFYVSSQIAYTLRKVDSLNWTPHMDECIRVLSESPEWEGDHVLVTMVKSQLIIDQLLRASWQTPPPSPPIIFVSALRSQVQGIKNEIPRQLKEDGKVKGVIAFTEFIVHQYAWRAQPPTSAGLTLQRHEILASMLSGIQTWFDAHFTLAPTLGFGPTFAWYSQMGMCLIALHWLTCVVNDPVWDRRAARQTIDLISVCDRVLAFMDAIAAERRRLASRADESSEKDSFRDGSNTIRMFRNQWYADLQGEQPTAQATVMATMTRSLDGDQRIEASSIGLSPAPHDYWSNEIFSFMNWEQVL
ncbi:hypothetical protein GQ53DRAFT_725352 [Thozetella sp. PMI_491]|nr:hypothetical protein GQ53DRAFT_725352 [Thozetella sp. PMI_491]